MPTKSTESVPYQRVIADNVKRLRDARGLSQADLAAAASAVGRRWKQSTVAQIETGRRSVSLGDFWLLQRILDAEIEDLLYVRGARKIDIDGVHATPAELIALATSQPTALDGLRKKFARSGHWVEPADKEYAIAERYGFEDDETPRLLVIDASQSAEIKAARKLGVSPFEIAAASYSLWRMSLSDKRDEVLATESKEGDQRALRGHVTRRLLTELAEAVASSKRQRRGQSR